MSYIHARLLVAIVVFTRKIEYFYLDEIFIFEIVSPLKNFRRKTFDMFYEKLELPFHQFIKLDTVIEEFQDQQAQNEHAEEFDKEEDGYLSDEDRGTLEVKFCLLMLVLHII